MHRILIWPDIRPAGYPANLKAGYRISGRISGKAGYRISGRISGSTHRLIVNITRQQLYKGRFINIFFSKLKKGETFCYQKPIAMF
jgi:hypothetical protein